MNFDGIYTPVITPLATDGSIDKAAFADVLEYLIDAKVHGIIVAATTGEYYAHTAQERYDLAKYAKEVIGSRVPLMVGTGAIRTEDSIEFAKVAKQIQADSILVTIPPYALPTEKEVAVHALSIDQAADLPVMFYNYPARMGVSMGKEFFDTVFAESKNFVGLKESSGEMNQLHMLARHYPELEISCGWDDQALEFFAWGARSWTCAGSNFIPHEHIALYEACVIEKDFDKGRRIMAAMMPLMDFLETGHFIQCIKYGCELNGLHTGSVRAPLQDMDAEKKQAFQSIVAELKRDVAAITGGV
jgi:4-hydroxy-tetrahydrodipicolinate synthase